MKHTKHITRSLTAGLVGLVVLVVGLVVGSTPAYAWSDPIRPESTNEPVAVITAGAGTASSWPVTLLVVGAVLVLAAGMLGLVMSRRRAGARRGTRPRTPALGV
jgi:hypothetical protein